MYIIRMKSDILEREDEFYKENKKLEQKTKELMKRVNDVMKIQDNLIKDSLKTKAEISNDNFKISYSNHPEYFELTGDCVENDEMAAIPKSVTKIDSKGASHFYKAQIKCLQGDKVILQSENRKGNQEIKKLRIENQNLLDEKEKWFIQYNSAKNSIVKLESQITSLSSIFQNRDIETISIKKELEQIKTDLKNSNFDTANFEFRLTKAHEENRNLKASLKIARDEEKELRDSYRKQINDLTTTVRHIEKHKTELLNGFQKQLRLIDNLKKQKVYLERHKIAAELSQSEYRKLLDLKSN